MLLGVLSSMGLGGGSVLLLYLTLIKGIEHKSASGINLLFFLPCALLSSILYIKQKIVSWSQVWPIMSGSALGAMAGAMLLSRTDPRIIRIGFAVLLLVVGACDLFSGAKSQRKSAK